VTTRKGESWFRPFFNIGSDGHDCPQPHGLIERGMPARVVQTIHDLRGDFTHRWDLWNCGDIATAWANQLQVRHPRTCIKWEGSLPGTDNPTSGYRVDGRGIRPHVWVTVGPRQVIFDPTAYQFDESSKVDLGYPKPGICLGRYCKDGDRFADLR
jgi:hypothetical protein